MIRNSNLAGKKDEKNEGITTKPGPNTQGRAQRYRTRPFLVSLSVHFFNFFENATTAKARLQSSFQYAHILGSHRRHTRFITAKPIAGLNLLDQYLGVALTSAACALHYRTRPGPGTIVQYTHNWGEGGIKLTKN